MPLFAISSSGAPSGFTDSIKDVINEDKNIASSKERIIVLKVHEIQRSLSLHRKLVENLFQIKKHQKRGSI